MMFDKLTIYVPGRLQSMANDLSPRDLLESYRMVLVRRAEAEPGAWVLPRSRGVDFETRQIGEIGTIAATKLKVRWADDRHHVGLTMNVNMTRTLIHSLSMADHGEDAISSLEAMRPPDFFARAVIPSIASTLDQNDNAFDDLDVIVGRLGRDYSRAFLPVFERQLKAWALEAVAPGRMEFRASEKSGSLFADDGVHRVSLDWSRLIVYDAEIYCERRYGSGAPELMERLNVAVLASHSDADWRHYDISEIGGRHAGSTVIGVAPTTNIKQVFYAKTADRVRIETRYKGKVRDHLRGAPTSLAAPLTDLLLLLRANAVSRIRWDSFCDMVSEPLTPLVSDFARMAGAIARSAAAAKVDPERVFAMLVGGAGFDQTRADGAFPLRLAKRLTDEGLLSPTNLNKRARPGQLRRHHLAEPYATVAAMIRRIFASSAPQP